MFLEQARACKSITLNISYFHHSLFIQVWVVALIVFLFLGFGQYVWSVTVTFTNDTTQIDDTTIYSSHTADNTGIYNQSRIGRTGATAGGVNRRLLMRLDLSSIPANATISDVTVQLNCIQVPSAPATPANVSIHRITNSWVEGNGNGLSGNGGEIVNGAASWTFREYPSVLWTTDGGDFSSSTSAITDVGASTGNKTWVDSGLVADIQGWVDGSFPNHGWIFIGDESLDRTVRVFGTSEESINFPTVTITYTTPGVTSVEKGIWVFYE